MKHKDKELIKIIQLINLLENLQVLQEMYRIKHKNNKLLTWLKANQHLLWQKNKVKPKWIQ